MSNPAPVLRALVGLVLLVGAGWVIGRELHQFGVHQVVKAFLSAPRAKMLTALAMTPLVYLLLTAYDLVAFQYIGRQLSYRRIIFAAFLGYAFSNSISMVPSMAIRYRLYSQWGLRIAEISKIFVFHILSTWLGFFAIGGTVLFFAAKPFAESWFLHPMALQAAGALLLALFFAYFGLNARFRGTIRIKDTEIEIPRPSIMLPQAIVATLDWFLVGLIPYILLPIHAELNYFGFLGIFLAAQLTQIVSHVPGGFGVFEGVMILLLKPYASVPEILAALLLYRVIYTLLPLFVASILLLVYESRSDAVHSKLK